jgi:hypothetical protein
MKRFMLVVVFLLTYFLLNTKYQILNAVYAQSACDPCGFCEGGTKPSDYDRCVTCLYENPGPPPAVEKEGVSWTVLGCIPTDPGSFTDKILQVVTAVIGGIMFLVFLYGGFKLLTSAGDPVQMAAGKKLITSSIVALLIVIFALVILRFVGVEILKLPGFE